MNLLTLNVDNVPFLEAASRISNMADRSPDILFVDWLPTNVVNDAVTEQIRIMESTPASVRIIIFDRHSSMTDGEVDFLLNKNAILLEPVLFPREGFQFMPYFIDRLDLPLEVWENDRAFHTGVKDTILSTESESFLLKCIKMSPEIRVGVDTTTRFHRDRREALKEVIVFGKHQWTDFESLVISGSSVTDDFDRGVMPDITQHMINGVIPMVSHKYKWFHSLFKNFLMFDENDILWYKRMFHSCNYGFMDEIYKNIDRYMPEMITENFVEKIVELGK